MRDNVIIGKPKNKATSHLTVSTHGIKNYKNISQNAEMYQIYECYLDITMYVYKDTVEGQTLSNMIKSGVSYERANKWLKKLLISKIAPEKLIAIIEDELSLAFNEGANNKAKEIRNSLGIYLNL